MKRMIILIFSILVMSACSETEDLSHQPDFYKAIGKSFVFQKDCQVIFTPLIEGFGENEKIVKKDYEIMCGNVPSPMKQVGSIKKGQILKIIRIDREKTVDTWYSPEFHVIITNAKEASRPIIDKIDVAHSDLKTSSLTNSSMGNSSVLGDPPIFSPEYLKPLKSDGIWWK